MREEKGRKKHLKHRPVTLTGQLLHLAIRYISVSLAFSAAGTWRPKLEMSVIPSFGFTRLSLQTLVSHHHTLQSLKALRESDIVLPSLTIPTARHFWKRQNWQRFLLLLSTGQSLLVRHTYFAFFCTVRCQTGGENLL